MMQRYLLYFAFFAFIMLIFLKLWQIIGDKISGEYFSISFFGRIFLPIIFFLKKIKKKGKPLHNTDIYTNFAKNKLAGFKSKAKNKNHKYQKNDKER